MIKTHPPVSGRPARLKTLHTAFIAILLGGIATSVSAADSVDLDAYRGKVVLLDFWASWCAPCRSSFPWMTEMHDKYGPDGLVVIAVNLDNEPAEAAGFLEEYPADFLIAYDSDRSLAREFGVDSMPNSFLIDRSGRVRLQHRGFRSTDKAGYEAAIVEVLGSGSSNGDSR